MFPPKINDFVVNLYRKTEKGELSWVYDDDNAVVQTINPEFNVSLRYAFNENKEVGEFVLFYYSAFDNKEYRFSTNQEWDDYENARMLFDIAQSSGLNLPF